MTLEGCAIKMISPDEIRRREFSKTIKGYAVPEVDEYIDYLLAKYKEAAEAYAELERKYKAAASKLEEVKNDENAISGLILNAQKMADAIVKDANDKARAVTEAASAGCDQILAAFSANVAKERDKLAKTEQLARDFKESLYNAYREHIDAIDKIMPEATEEPSLSEATDEELLNSAIDLAERKMKESAQDEIELPPMTHGTAQATEQN